MYCHISVRIHIDKVKDVKGLNIIVEIIDESAVTMPCFVRQLGTSLAHVLISSDMMSCQFKAFPTLSISFLD